MPLKSSSWLFSLDVGTGIYKFGINTYPRPIRRRSNLGHIFRGEGEVRLMGREIRIYHRIGNDRRIYLNKITFKVTINSVK